VSLSSAQLKATQYAGVGLRQLPFFSMSIWNNDGIKKILMEGAWI
jgi:hypothetical protein